MINLWTLKRIGWRLSCLIVLVLAACEKKPIQDGVEQQWKLERFTVLATGEVVQADRLFYTITRMVTEVAEKQISNGSVDGTELKNLGAYVACTEYRDKGAVLVLKDFKVRGATSDQKVDATVEQLMPFGIDNPKETVFIVLKSSHRELVLESDYARVELVKF